MKYNEIQKHRLVEQERVSIEQHKPRSVVLVAVTLFHCMVQCVDFSHV